MHIRQPVTRLLATTCLALTGIAAAWAQSATDWSIFWPETGDGLTEGQVVRVDSQGNTLVTGSTEVGDEEHAFVQKYDTNGVLLWTATFDDVGPSCACPMDMQLDASGNAFVAGHVENLDTGLVSWLTFKVSSGGTVQWSHTEFTGELSALQVGPSGQVFVTGFAMNLGSYDIVTRKYSTNGGIVWTKAWNGPGNTNDLGNSIAVDDSGDLYVGGYSEGSTTGTALVQRLIKYTQNGARLWTKTFALPGVDTVPGKVVAKPAGGCIVASQTSGTDWSTSYVVVSSHDTDGNPIWRRTTDISSERMDEFVDMAMVNDQVTIACNIDSEFDTDILVRRYNSAGNVLWTKKYSLAGGGDELASSIGVTQNNQTYVCGVNRATDGSWQSLILKYSSSGIRLWDSLYASPEGYALANNLAVDGEKAVFVGTSQTTESRIAMMLSRIQ